MTGVGEDYLQYAKTELKILRSRNSHFAQTQVFGDPAWELILEAFVAIKEARSLLLSDLSKELRKPVAIIRRLSDILEAKGHVERLPSPDHAGETSVRLTAEAVGWCENFLRRQMEGDDFSNN